MRPRSNLWARGTGALSLGLIALFLVPGLLKGASPDPEDTGRAESLVSAATPDGLVPATGHEAVVVPAGPEDPAAPARTFTDPEPAPAGDVSASLPVPDYLKGSPYRLSFVTGDYTPPADERIDPRLLEGLGRVGRNYTYGYVMFEGAIQARKVKALEQQGLVFFNNHTFNCLQAYIPASAIPALRVSPYVRWVGYARPEQKVDEFLLKELMNPGADPVEGLHVYVNVFESDLGPRSRMEPVFGAPPEVAASPHAVNMPAMVMMSNGPLQQALAATGAQIKGYEDSIQTFFVIARRDVVRRLMRLDFVAGIDTAFPPEPVHDRSMRMTNADYIGGLSTPNYGGENATVAVVDSGAYWFHHDISQAWGVGWDYTSELSAFRDDCGHGTHVAGTVFGDGSARADRRYRGTAPRCGTQVDHSVYILKIFDQGCNASSNVTSIFKNHAITAWSNTTRDWIVRNQLRKRATVVQNSWKSGFPSTGGYYGTDSLSRACDTNTHTYNQVYVCAAGNDGGSKTNQRHNSCVDPASSKSSLTVGNVLDYHDQYNYYGGDYPGAQAYNSSKGPTRDGRIKPEVSAPGTWIVSAKTNSTTLYVAKYGTSMAAPHVSGLAAIMHSVATQYVNNPALTRAKIMAASSPYAGGRLTTLTTSESYVNRRGLGTVDALATLFSLPQPKGWNGGWGSFTLTNASGGAYIEVSVPSDATYCFFVMTWDEKAPALNATQAVLYDLDLVIDAEPFASSINAGEFASRSRVDNKEFYGIGTVGIAQVRGKKVRIKAPFITKPSSSSEQVRVGIAYHFARGDITPTALVTPTVTPTLMKPGATVTMTADALINDYRANGLYMYLDAPGFTPTTLRHTTRDGRSLNTDTVVSNSQDSKANWTLGDVEYSRPITSRKLTWTLQAPYTSREYWVWAYARGTGTSPNVGGTKVCVDGLAPNPPANVRSTTHTRNQWSNQRNFTAAWDAATDEGCAGMAGYGYVLNRNSCFNPTSRNLGNVTSDSAILPPTPGSRYYINIEAYDMVGNVSSYQCVGPYLLDTEAPAVVTTLWSNTHQVGQWSNRDSITMYWSPPPTNGGSPNAGYSVLWDHRATTIPPTNRVLAATTYYTTSLTSSTEGYYFHIRGVDGAGNWGSTRHIGPFLIDASVPAAPTGVTSTSHATGVWSNNPLISVTWTPPPAGAGSPIDGYGVLFNTSATSTPSQVRSIGAVTTLRRTLNSSAAGQYFHIRAVDRAVNWGPAAHAGPYLIDAVIPYSARVYIENNAAKTTTLVVTLTGLLAYDAHSGVGMMRFSNDGTNWSPFYAYASSHANWDLSAFGGNPNGGTKRVYAQYQDKAGNRSTPVSDTIEYEGTGPSLSISAITPNLGTLIGDDVVAITGNGFVRGNTRVTFGGVAATQVTVVSSGLLSCKTPTHLRWESVEVRVSVGTSSASRPDGFKYVGANILATGNPKLGTPFPITFNAPVDGGKPYVAAASLGAGPIPLPPHGALQLTPDVLFLLTLNNLVPQIFGNFAGTLNTTGQAYGIVTQPNIPALAGSTFYVAFLTLDPAKPLGIRTVSEGRSFRIMP